MKIPKEISPWRIATRIVCSIPAGQVMQTCTSLLLLANFPPGKFAKSACWGYPKPPGFHRAAPKRSHPFTFSVATRSSNAKRAKELHLLWLFYNNSGQKLRPVGYGSVKNKKAKKRSCALDYSTHFAQILVIGCKKHPHTLSYFPTKPKRTRRRLALRYLSPLRKIIP